MAIDTLGANALASNSVTNAKIASDAVTTAKIANDAVTGAKIPADAVVAADIADGSITTAKLADDAVTGAKIGTGEVKSDNIENSTSLHLACTYTSGDATVTTASTSSLVVGMEMYHSHGSLTLDPDHLGGRIPAGAKVLSITNSTTFEMSANALAAGTDITTHFTSGVTKSKIANSSVSIKKRADHDQELAPRWTRPHYSSNLNYGYTLIDEYGTRINMQNGNNGPAGIARLEGTTGHGDFTIIVEPSYLWGWGGIYAADVAGFSDLEDPQWMYGSGRNAGYHAVEFLNNSSNNQGNIGHYNGSSFSYLQQNSGVNGGDWRLWRVNGVLKAKAGGNSIVTIHSSGDRRDYVIWNQAQSPCYCRVKQAFRNASGGA